MKNDNNLFYTCSLIEYIGRITKNKRKDLVQYMKSDIGRIYNYADVFHCEPIEKVADDFIEESSIQTGDFDNVAKARYSVPTHWDIGKVYKRLVLAIMKDENVDVAEAVFKAYHSFISEKIDDYNSSVFYDNPQNIFLAYKTGTL